jgi:hypothetical protein
MRGITLLLVLCACVLGPPALADGMMLTNTNPNAEWEREYVTEVDQKAAIFYSGNTETLIISPSFQGDASSFAWVVPVPSRPRVSIVQGALFHELSSIAYINQPQPQADVEEKAQSFQFRGGVTVVERRTIGAYDVSVLDANDTSALHNWLRANGYAVPNSIAGPLSYYIDHHWTFVASRVKVPKDAHGLATGTLAPLKLTFTSSHPVYPMRLSSANAEPFSLLVYLIRPLRELPMASQIAKIAGPVGHTGPTSMLVNLRADPGSYPTLAALQSGEMAIYIERGTFDPASCRADFIWSTRTVVAYNGILWGILSAAGCAGLAFAGVRACGMRSRFMRS